MGIMKMNNINQKQDNREWLIYGSVIYYNEILKDLQEEPVEVCNWDKRKRCDSYYIKLYNQAIRDYKKLLDDYKKLNQAYLDIENKLIELQNTLKGGEDECLHKRK